MSALRTLWPGVLLGIYPLLVLVSRNPATDRLESLAVGILFSASVAWVASLLARRATSDPARRTLLVASCNCALFLPGLARESTRAIEWLYDPIAFAALWTALNGLLVLAVLRTCSVAATASFLRAFSLLLLAGPALMIGKQVLDQSRSSAVSPDTMPRSAATLPSIYLIITDKYTSSAALKESYDFDNAEVERELRALGFVVPRTSRTNYIHTFLSLASFLNWSYLDSLTATYGSKQTSREPAYRMIQRNRLVSHARARGYRVIEFSSPYPPLKMRDADEVIDLSRTDLSMVSLWWEQTLLGILWNIQCGARGCAAEARTPFSADRPSVVIRKLDSIAALAANPGPHLVIAHLLLPHEPYSFEADCTPRPPYFPIADTGQAFQDWRRLYVAQITCTNRLVVSLAKRIIARSPRPPIILVQADHGHGGIDLNKTIGLTVPLEQLSPAAIRDRTSAFAAYYLPGMAREPFQDSVTPVNVLPLVLNHYWGEKLPVQPNRTYWAEFAKPFHFVLIPTSDSPF